jgi:hypothetical protein
MAKQKFIDDLQKENSTFSTQRQAEMVANLLDTVSSDIYSESQRFVFELIQNADDAAQDTNNEVHFDFLLNCLIVSHNGKPFDDNDIISLTGAGASTKKADPTKTGYKGIGFKSVFGKSERVAIFSDGYQFRFDRSVHKTKLPWQIIPLWTDLKDLAKEVHETISLSKYSVSTIIELKNADSLLTELNELLRNGQILLFLRRISKISVSQNGKSINSIEKKNISEGAAYKEVTLLNEGKEISSWLTKTFEKIPIPAETKVALNQDDKTPEKLKEAVFTEISFAAKIEEGRIKELKGDDSLIFTYLPTSVSKFQFPFLINGSFLTTANRQDIHSDRIWNQWLFTLIAEKTLEWIEILAKGKFIFQILHLLPQKFNGIQNELRVSFDNSLENLAKDKSFVPTKSQKLKMPSELIIDKTGLSDLKFISTDTVIDFINQKENTNFKSDSFVNSKLQRVDKLRSFGTKYFDIENLESFFLSQIFKDNHQPSDNFSLIEYFYTKASKDESREWNEKLKEISFIYAKGNKLKSPKTVCFPSITFENEFGDGVTVIHSDVYPKIESNSKIKNWLELLGVKEPSDTAYLENEIIGNIENSINNDNYQRVTRYIFNQHKKSLLEDWHYSKLQDLKIFTISKEFIPAKQCYLSNIYEPLLKLEKVNEAGKYVSENYKQPDDYASEWKTFFLKIGVSENISVINITTSIYNANGMIEKEYFNQVGEEAKNGHRYPHLVGSTNSIRLDRIRFSEFAKDYKFSIVFWQQAIRTIQPGSVYQYAYMPWGYYGSQEIVQNYFYWSLKHSAIFPATTKECLKADKLYINEKEIKEIAGKYLPVFDYDEPLPQDWKNILPFKEKLELDDYLLVLVKIAEQTEEDDVLRKYNRKKIGLIYNKLATLLSDFSNDKREIIKSWANENKLLSANGKFENAIELKWIKIDGFTTTSEKLKVIQLPENCDTTSKAFEELISLFQVQIIKKFIPTFEKEKKEFDLKKKLQNILPYLVAIMERKKYADFTKEFERLFFVVSRSEFYNTAEIKLSFNHQDEIIEVASLNVFRADSNLYFKGRWRSPITMFNLIPELASLLDVAGLNDELRLLLELDEVEIMDWLTSLGYDISSIKIKPEYLIAKKPIKVETSVKVLTAVTTEMEEVAEPEVVYEDQEMFEVTKFEFFEPEISAEADEIADIKPTRKKFTAIDFVEQPKYAEIADNEVRFEIGRWSEKYVFNNLNKWGYSEIVWENELGESGKPYDFRVKENGNEKYIEVKGTPSSKKDLVYLSTNEWNLMVNQKDNYILIRVYNAGNSNVSPIIIENPSQQIEQGSIQVALRV